MSPATGATFLFVPGDRPERFAKAAAAGADAIIIDLEDAVSPDAKEKARRAVAAYLREGRTALVRLNACGTEWHDSDIEALSVPGLKGIVLPKSEDVAELESITRRLPGKPIIPLVETGRGFANLAGLAKVHGVCRFAFGTIDFQLDLGIQGEGEELLYFRSRMVLESRLANLAPPLDGVSLATDDNDALKFESRRSRRLGFGGSSVSIHGRCPWLRRRSGQLRQSSNRRSASWLPPKLRPLVRCRSTAAWSIGPLSKWRGARSQ